MGSGLFVLSALSAIPRGICCVVSSLSIPFRLLALLFSDSRLPRFPSECRPPAERERRASVSVGRVNHPHNGGAREQAFTDAIPRRERERGREGGREGDGEDDFPLG